MPTRFYLTSTPSQINPAFDASWEDASGVTVLQRRVLSTVRLKSAFVSVGVAEATATSPYDVACAMFISDALQAQTISGNVKGIVRALESNADADMRVQLSIRVLANTGLTYRGVLLAHDASAVTAEFDAATLTNRKIPLAWASSPGTAIASLAVEDGDRIVVELGYRAHNAIAGSRTGTVQIGDSGALDCAENETDQLAYNPWLEFDATILFAGARAQSRARRRGTREEAAVTTRFGGHSLTGGIESSVNMRNPVRGRSARVPLTGSVNLGGGGAQVTKFKMRATASPGGGPITWIVTGTPDFAGASAPGAIVPTTAVVAAQWVEG